MQVSVAKTPIYLDRNDLYDPAPIASTGIYTLAAIARRSGHDVYVSDPSLWSDGVELEDQLWDWIPPDSQVICLSANSFNWPLTRLTSIAIKNQAPDKIVIIGGIHPTHRAEHVLVSSNADYVVRGEGEIPLAMLLERFGAGADMFDVPGITFCSNNQIVHNEPPPPLDLETDDHPVPAFDLMPPDAYGSLAVETSRGCPFACSFCSIASHNRWRAYPALTVVDRLARASELGGDRVSTDHIYFTDDCFTSNRKRARKICDLLVERGYEGRLAMEARVNDLLHDDLLDGLRLVRPRYLQVGVECGYDRGLKLIGKGTDIERVLRCAERLAGAGIVREAMLSFIIGLPWETREECMTTLRFAACLTQEYGLRVRTAWWVPMPSRLWNERADYGIAVPDEVFDQLAWHFDRDLFMAIRPRITESDCEQIREFFLLNAQMGHPLRNETTLERVSSLYGQRRVGG